MLILTSVALSQVVQSHLSSISNEVAFHPVLQSYAPRRPSPSLNRALAESHTVQSHIRPTSLRPPSAVSLNSNIKNSQYKTNASIRHTYSSIDISRPSEWPRDASTQPVHLKGPFRNLNTCRSTGNRSSRRSITVIIYPSRT